MGALFNQFMYGGHFLETFIFPYENNSFANTAAIFNDEA
jgi:hypothetical protein